jgi:uncharacterized protein (TIGR00730 family)
MAEQPDRHLVTVFGGSRCGPDSPEYAQALELGRLLVESGFDVCSGGYYGVMEAISRGAHEAGGHVTGFTMNQFKAAPNSYLRKIVPSRDFYERLQGLIPQSVGYVALRGGMGTVTEISLVWNQLQTGVLASRPLVLLGACWPSIIACMRQHLVVSDQDVSHLSFARTPERAVAILEASLTGNSYGKKEDDQDKK